MFEATKTVSGSLVQIYARDVGPERRIHGAYLAKDEWYIASWAEDGSYHPKQPRALDLAETVQNYVNGDPELA